MTAAYFLLAFLFVPSSARADIVILNSGKELTGIVRNMDADKIYLESGGKEEGYSLKDVLKVKFIRQWDIPGENDVSQISDRTLKDAIRSPAKPEDYPDDGYLTYLYDSLFVFKKDKTWTATNRTLQLILRERGKDGAGNTRFYYINGLRQGEIDYARSITGGHVSYTDDTSVQAGSEFSDFPNYDRLKSIKFSIPNVSTGSFVDYQYQTKAPIYVSTYPFIDVERFRFFEPALLSRLTVVVPKELKLLYIERRMPKDTRFRREESKDEIRYIWEVNEIPAFKPEDQMPPYARIAPTVMFSLADTWENIASSFSSILRKQEGADPELAAKVRDIVKEAKSPEQKVEALYNWVVKKIKHRPVSMDNFSYVPKTPAEIYRAKEGNDLDEPFLLYAMLRQAGFRPELVYMVSKSDDPFEKSLPNIRQFSAAAVRLTLNGRTLFLTPLDDALRYKEIPSWLQGMEGLIILGSDKVGTFTQIPMIEAEKESEDVQSRMSLQADGSIVGTEIIRAFGSSQAYWRRMKDWKKEDLDKYFEQLAHNIHPNARLTFYSIDHLNDLTKDLTVRLNYSVKDYAITAAGGFLAFRIPWVHQSAEEVGPPTRESAIYWFEREQQSKKVAISLPAGYSIYYAPGSVHLDGPGSTYQASYTAKDGTLVFNEKFVRNMTELPAKDYIQYKNFREDTSRFTEKWIVLKKKVASADTLAGGGSFQGDRRKKRHGE